MAILRKSLIALGFAGALASSGCGTPAAPQAPSLNLPTPVQDLSVSRTGDQVHLHWTMPKKNTDRLTMKGLYTVHLCFEEGGKCVSVADVQLGPALSGDYNYTLPVGYLSGANRPMVFHVELQNHAGRSAGLSNPAVTLAGPTPAAVAGFGAQVRAEGGALHWNASSPAEVVRLRRLLLNPQAQSKKESSSLTSNNRPESASQNLLVKPQNGADPGQAIDLSVQPDRKYRYTAERVLQQPGKDKTIEISSAPSDWIQVDTRDVFPPSIPAGLISVAVPEEHSIDLSWTPDSEADLAGYLVYRREGTSSPVRISPAQPLPGPSYRDLTVQPGHQYFYSVSAIDRSGNESAKSPEIGAVYP
jgi:hypothetical protein